MSQKNHSPSNLIWRFSPFLKFVRAIARVETSSEPADRMLRHFFREEPNIGQHDRALIAEGVFAFLRRRRSIKALAATTRPFQLALLTLTREGIISVEDACQLAKSAEDRAFAQSLPERLAFPLEWIEKADVPDDLWTMLERDFSPEERDLLAQTWQKPAAFDLRVNTMKISRDDALEALTRDGYGVEKTPYSPFGLRLSSRASLARYPLLIEGSLEVQSESSQMVGLLVSPKRGEMIADFCAGAGGKTLLLGMLTRSTGRLYAFDVSEKRLQNLSPRLKRSGLSNVHPIRIAHENDPKLKRLAGKMDRVLVDAPCSGSGTFQRNPDLKWRFSHQAIEELTQKQASILLAASRLVKPGGRLVYATCSVLSAENEAIIEAFLKARPMFSIEPIGNILENAEILKPSLCVGKALEGKTNAPTNAAYALKLFPHIHHTDGFFAAVLKRDL